MPTATYKAIISDLDGTLAPLTLRAKVSRKVIAAIQSVQKRNIHFSIATGKPFHLITHLIEEIGLTSPVIVDNGAAIYSPSGDVIWESVISDSDLRMIYSIAGHYKRKHIKISSGKESFFVEEHLPDGIQATKFLFMSSPEAEAEKFINHVEQMLKDVAVIRAASYEGEGFTDVYVTNAEGTKQHSVLKLADILGITTEEIVAIGDGYNDFPLFMACGYKVAMGNGVRDLKDIADYVAPPIEEDGVAVALEKLFLHP